MTHHRASMLVVLIAALCGLGGRCDNDVYGIYVKKIYESGPIQAQALIYTEEYNRDAALVYLSIAWVRYLANESDPILAAVCGHQWEAPISQTTSIGDVEIATWQLNARRCVGNLSVSINYPFGSVIVGEPDGDEIMHGSVPSDGQLAKRVRTRWRWINVHGETPQRGDPGQWAKCVNIDDVSKILPSSNCRGLIPAIRTMVYSPSGPYR